MSALVERMAYRGQVPWHGIGERIIEDVPLEEWRMKAGLDWEVAASPIWYKALPDSNQLIQAPQFRCLVRSDNAAALGVVGKHYKPVQPMEIIEFYRTLVEAGGMKLETAGSLRDGKTIWALADTRQDFSIDGDELKRYILLATSYDGTMATLARHTSVRVVCNNTLFMSLGEKGDTVSVSHQSRFDADQVKMDLGLDLELTSFKENVERLASAKISIVDASVFFMKVYFPAELEKSINPQDLESAQARNKHDALMTGYVHGPGSNLSSAKGTLWGALNSVTYFQDHATKAKSIDSRIASAWFGEGRRIKQKAFDVALKMAA